MAQISKHADGAKPTPKKAGRQVPPSKRNRLMGFAIGTAVLLVGLAITLYVSSATRQSAEVADQLRFDADAKRIFNDIKDNLEAHASDLNVLQKMLRDGVITEEIGFDLAANLIQGSFEDFVSINLIDENNQIVHVWPMEANKDALGRTVGQTETIRDLLRAARDSDEPRATAIVDLFQGGQGIVTYHPLVRDERFIGYLNTVFRVSDVNGTLGSIISDQYRINIHAGSDLEQLIDIKLDRRFLLPFMNQKFELHIVRAATELPSSHTSSHLVLGLILSLLASMFSILIYFSLSSSRRANAMLSEILHLAPTAIVSIDSGGSIIVFNPAAEKMFQRTALEMLGQPMDILVPSEHHKQHAHHVEEFKNSSVDNRMMGDWRVIHGQRADGTKFPVLASLGKSRFEGLEVMSAVLRDMTEETAVQVRLKELADESSKQARIAEEANTAKTMFLASMSHELRTLLNAVLGFSDLMHNEVFGPVKNAKYQEYIADIFSSSKMLLELINDILNYAKIESNAYDFELRPVVVRLIAADCLRQFGPMANQCNVHIEDLKVPADLVVMADARALRQVLTNLISNAIKFTGSGGSVRVECVTEPGSSSALLSVSDSGRGMTPEQLKLIGQPFVQLSDSYVSGFEGSGLGLAISQKLAEGMNSRLEFDSQIGHGTVVKLSLKLSESR